MQHSWLPFLFGGAIGLFLLGIIILVPSSPWRDAVAVKVCGGLPVIRSKDGALWLVRQDGYRAYRIEDLAKLECVR